MNLLKLILLFTLVLSSLEAVDPYFRTEKKHFKGINKAINSSKPGKRFVLVQSADTAQLVPNKDKAGEYQLVLDNISPYIQFYKAQPNKSFGIIFMTQFVWFCKIGKSMFLKSKRGALGYISCANCNIDPDNKPEVMELLRPKYLKKDNKLIYEVANVDTFKMNTKEMKKVTLVIDLALD